MLQLLIIDVNSLSSLACRRQFGLVVLINEVKLRRARLVVGSSGMGDRVLGSTPGAGKSISVYNQPPYNGLLKEVKHSLRIKMGPSVQLRFAVFLLNSVCVQYCCNN